MKTIDDDNGKKWEHVRFWNKEEEVHQIHPKESEYVHSVGHAANPKRNILHLWRPVGGWRKDV
jgi:hypothetical protein